MTKLSPPRSSVHRHPPAPPTPPAKNGHGVFFREFLRKPTQVGSIAPSSVVLARKMIEGLNLAQYRSIVEYGPGTGVFTRAVLEQLPRGWHHHHGGQGKFIAVEFNPAMAAALAATMPDVIVKNDSAENILDICKAEGIAAGTLDAIVSGLAWTAFSSELRTSVLKATVDALKPGGEFRTFAYQLSLLVPGAWHFRREARRMFSKVEISRPVWANVPPAVVYRCVK